MTNEADWQTLPHTLLCTVEFRVDGAMIPIGDTPWGTRRIGYIAGGVVKGERLSGEVLPGGGNWAEAGRISDGTAISTFDARTIWRTHDGATIYVTHGGRMAVPPASAAAFADPSEAALMDKSGYYARILPLFETADPRYQWLNAIVAVGCGRRIAGGIRYTVFEIA